MFDHLTIGCSDFDRICAFYERALAPLGLRRLVQLTPEDTQGPELAGFGRPSETHARPRFWISGERPVSGLVHIAFQAASRQEVTQFHAQAIAAGGVDNGPPGLRGDYAPGYFAGYVRDPDGHNIEAVFID